MQRISITTSLLAFSLGACAWAPPADETVAEESVGEDLNGSFLADDLDVGRFARIFEGESREVFRQRERILATLGIQTGMAVADVGAGTGLFIGPLNEAVGENGVVYAVDISPGFVDHLRGRVRREGLEAVEVVLCDERSASLPEESVDVVFVCDTYHHFEYPRSTVASLHRALRPGGSLVVVDFDRIPYVSRPWILGHVRAGQQAFVREIEAEGFELIERPRVFGLLENYVLRFRKS
ncbi:MAG: class I SAM-dependent methyltransferase [Planctomycetota bacterium]|nr:class I SAM-dependent methyltransferase [Planctomycetota bacterium]